MMRPAVARVSVLVENLHRHIIVLICVLSVAYSALQIQLNLQDEVVSDASDTMWAFSFALLVAVWAKKEPGLNRFSPPFEFGAFMYFAWPLVLPYYLCKTRGIEGVVTFMGFVALYTMPFLSGLIAYVYFTG